MKKNEAIMKLFKAYLVESDNKKELSSINEDALKVGIYISDDCSKDIVSLACMLWGKNGFLLNQTFHKSFKTVLQTEKEELIIQQMMHYLTTYGFKELGIYDEKFVYLPNEKLEIPELNNDIKLIKINSITKEELKERLLELCKSSIPLSKETVEYIVELSEYMEITEENISFIKNKEVKIALFNKLDILPEEPEEFFRFLLYSLIGKTLVIKDRTTINALQNSDRKKALSLICQYNKQHGERRLAEIFNRFKPLFLALKTSVNSDIEEEVNYRIKNRRLNDDERELNKIINKISHLSKKYHKPMIKNDLDRFVDWCIEHELEDDFEEQVKEKIELAGIWRAIKLKNYLQYESLKLKQHVYKIRNGKVWIQDKQRNNNYNSEKVVKILDRIIVDMLKKKFDGKKIYLDGNVDFVLPQSEKQFIGNIPFGSSITIDKDNVLFAIHWINVGTESVDLDLKIISNEYTIGWDAEYKETDKLIFSGDVTDAPYPKGATECIYVDKTIGKSIFSLKINNFTSDVDNIEYDFIIAKGNKDKLKENYIIDPNDILIKIPKVKIEKGKAEHSIGTVIIDDQNIKLIFTDLCTSDRISSENNEQERILRNYIDKESQCKCKLREYLEKAGATIINNKGLADIDLSLENLDRDSLLIYFYN